ncbi:hypothetical protein SNEBB_009947 [Seison nebaliae]|nr:hypothetical protein SNEBB_009947 [Seison nebaliae]
MLVKRRRVLIYFLIFFVNLFLLVYYYENNLNVHVKYETSVALSKLQGDEREDWNIVREYMTVYDFVGFITEQIFEEIEYFARRIGNNLKKTYYSPYKNETLVKNVEYLKRNYPDYYDMFLKEEHMNIQLINWNSIVDHLIRRNETNSYKHSPVLQIPPSGKKKIILLYSTIFNKKPIWCTDWHTSNKCLYQNCRVTCDKNEVDAADVVILHDIINMETQELSHKELKDKIKPHQKLIFWSDETSYSFTLNYRYATSFTNLVRPFNWTMGYSRFSEIQLPYGTYRVREQPDNTNHRQTIMNEFKSRKNAALWFVSNCGDNMRNSFVKKLKKYLTVDIYGKCTNKECDEECRLKLSKEYKFYLSFENSNCTDYITEKFYRNALGTGMIPIVFQPNYDSYSRIAPPNSFIHPDSIFGDTMNYTKYMFRFGKYLKNVAASFPIYYSYRKWEEVYKSIHPAMQTRLCQLCTRLNIDQTKREYVNLQKFHDKMCFV